MRRLSVLFFVGACAALIAAPAARANDSVREALKRPPKRIRLNPNRVTRESVAKPERQKLDAAFYIYTMRGSGLEAIEREAKDRALAATVGELYFENRFVLAPELLEVYLGARVDDYIAGLQILETRQGVGAIEADIQVAVDKRKLESDLMEKRFFYEPKRRPRYHISLAETIDGLRPETGPGRLEALEALESLGGQASEYEIAVPANNLDVDANQDLLYEALIASRRAGVELLITGTASARLEEEKRYYYTEYTFYTVDIALKLINVQNGKTIRQVSLTAQGNNPEQAKAAADALRRGARDATTQLLDGFAEEWRAATQDEGDFRVLISGIGAQPLESFVSRLESSLRDKTGKPRVYVKSYVNGVAVLNIYFQGHDQGEGRSAKTSAKLLDFLRESRYPKFNIDSFDDYAGKVRLSILE